MTAIPVIRECIQNRPDLTILMPHYLPPQHCTYELQHLNRTICCCNIGLLVCLPQLTPAAINAFLGYWKPNAIAIMENELWPNLLWMLRKRVSSKHFHFDLLHSNMQAIHFQLLLAPPFIINFSGDLKFAVKEFDISERKVKSIEDLKVQLAHRQVWMASSIHKGEEEVIFCCEIHPSTFGYYYYFSGVYQAMHCNDFGFLILGVHEVLIQVVPDLITIIAPRYPQHGQEIAQKLQKEGKSVALRSRGDKLITGTNIYIVDTLGELRYLYGLTPIAVIGGSFLPYFTGHNIAEAAAAGCAILTGPHVGHFSRMVLEMQRSNPLSVLQVSGKLELEQALRKLFSNVKVLEVHRMAAKQAYYALSSGIVAKVWNLLNYQVLQKL
ncbi:hypothetical protein FEM48_ZijujUnG0005600 [Ziziphus jujuba var. spinosa]|uniref:lipid IVA 3-deoxy-D-manno-octulosonic acid transferase n=1 Tax=Ziziphus jujuba var. spinosa TaxID=714518 RepID=A0A978UA20_ZIZJJ|nr:hypothetical protein FEM48_ZijujUnG0005600 [Ziziphus jujuba var. spinosa]